jgi:rare lipoprotein A (peptidoglycan hydrolase)
MANSELYDKNKLLASHKKHSFGTAKDVAKGSSK